DFGGANVVGHLEKHFPGEEVADPAKTYFTFDCNVPANTIGYANNQHICRLFARREGVHLHDVDAGIGSHIMIEQGIAVPGTTVVGTDSHLNILGAVGAFGQGMGDQDIAFGFRTGRTWFEVPETIRIEVRGTYEFPTTAKDLTLYIVGKLGSKGLLGCAAEFYGEAVDALSLAERITLASMVTEMGGIIGFIPPSDDILAFFRARTGRADIPTVQADPDATYVRTVEVDVTGLDPQIALSPKPDKVVPVREVGDITVDSVFIGSCTNGRMEDLQAAARLLKGRQVAPGVMLRIVPATREVWREMLSSGLMAELAAAGAIISNQGCGGCASGQIGMTGKNEVQVSTGNRNFAGKQGDGFTYLASPVTAAAAALTGRIVTPEDVL
ncbi:MAG: 3-isopropylmalate dehydratase large subunit, partial [Acidobacteria bacterium]|nr:3-isopropylmalate dehydratase large subunit [Acidobacteriota bacterium]